MSFNLALILIIASLWITPGKLQFETLRIHILIIAL